MTSPFQYLARTTAAVAVLALLAGCGGRGDKGPVRVDVIGTHQQMNEPLANGSNAAGQTVLAATAQGLVAFDAGGDLVGGLAERWIVDDGGQSYLFRLKRAHWSDGSPVKAEQVATLLKGRFAAYPAIVAGLDPQVRGMTDEVLEIRLPGPMPSFLQLLAHPAMAIARKGTGTGPFHVKNHNGVLTLTPLRPDERTDDDETAGNAQPTRTLFLRPARGALGFARFERHHSDLLLGGRFQHLPYVTVSNLPNGAVRADPVNGLLGLMVEGKSDFLANRDVREVLSSALNRDRLSQILNLSGWRTATNILPAQLDLDRAPAQVSWADRDLALRQSYGRSVVSNWTGLHSGTPPTLRIALPAGPGARLLFQSLQQDYTAIGLSAVLVPWDAPADLRLVDEVAPFDSAIWYLSRVGCGPNKLCSEDAEAELEKARKAATEEERAAALAQAETLSLAEANYIPLGMPVRFALVRGRLTGYLPSPRARHPLNALFRAPR
ncbi:MAG TPA: ABC transporter substrate-binding protein [Sphingobium sp.]|uniref:ABC transporter substrate-binding protein n=1 Tax=Sphingobium sp. TaxID=1912891 RepID=UPI002ED6ABE8